MKMKKHSKLEGFSVYFLFSFLLLLKKKKKSSVTRGHGVSSVISAAYKAAAATAHGVLSKRVS